MSSGAWRGFILNNPRIKYDMCKGAWEKRVIQDAIEVASVLGTSVEVDIRGVLVRVTERSDPVELGFAILLERQNKKTGPVGPLERPDRPRNEWQPVGHHMAASYITNPRFTFDVHPRRRAQHVITDAVRTACVLGMTVEIVLSDVVVRVTPRTKTEDLLAELKSEITNGSGQVVGPCERGDD